MSMKMKRAIYADMFGPTTGDRVRLADTDLIIEVEKDFTTYGEEVKFGGGKVIRDGMGQSQATNKQGAANPDTPPHGPIVIGPGPDVIAGEGKILTAGGFDSHIHFICPQQIEHALM